MQVTAQQGSGKAHGRGGTLGTDNANLGGLQSSLGLVWGCTKQWQWRARCISSTAAVLQGSLTALAAGEPVVAAVPALPEPNHCVSERSELKMELILEVENSL